MARTRRALHALATLVATSTGAAASGQTLPPLGPLLPAAVASARPHGLELAPRAPDRVTWAVTLAYGNSFSFDDDVHASHRLVDPAGAPLSDAAWGEAVASQGNHTTWAVDMEMLRLDLEAVAAVDARLRIGVRLPAWSTGGTALDAWPRRWHRAIGVDDAGRELYPDRQTVCRVARGGAELDFSGSTDLELGDLTAWATWDLPRWGRLEPRAWLSITAPTGGDLGVDGWAGGLRWAAALTVGALELEGGVGVTAVADAPGPWPAANPLWHAWVGGDLRLSDTWRFGLIARSDGSPYRETLSDRPAAASAELALGPSVRLADGVWLQVALGEDFPGMGLAPDFSIQARLLLSTPRPRRHVGTTDATPEETR